jgi:hypothetical protein
MARYWGVEVFVKTATSVTVDKRGRRFSPAGDGADVTVGSTDGAPEGRGLDGTSEGLSLAVAEGELEVKGAAVGRSVGKPTGATEGVMMVVALLGGATDDESEAPLELLPWLELAEEGEELLSWFDSLRTARGTMTAKATTNKQTAAKYQRRKHWMDFRSIDDTSSVLMAGSILSGDSGAVAVGEPADLFFVTEV